MDMLKNLAAFVQVARSGSLTAAAAELGITTPTVSKALSALERTVDARLMRRTTRRVSLTADGRALLESAVAALARIDQTVDLLREGRKEPAGVVRLWASAAIGRDHLLPLLHEFMKRHTKVEVEICFDDHMPDLVTCGYDLAVQYSPRTEKSYMVKHLCELPLTIVASPTYVSEYGTPRDPEQLAQHQCIVTRNALGQPTAWLFNGRSGGTAANGGKSKGRSIRIVPAGRLRVVEQYDAVLGAALVGLGITVVFAHSALRYLNSGELVALLPDWRVSGVGLETSDVFLCYPQRESLPYRARALADFIVQWFQDPQRQLFDPNGWPHTTKGGTDRQIPGRPGRRAGKAQA